MYYGNLTKIATKIINFNDTALCYRQSLEGPILTSPGIQKHACFSYKLSVFPKKRGSPSSPTPMFAKQVYFQFKFFTIILAGILKLTSETQPGTA